jgi:hypothetical protein
MRRWLLTPLVASLFLVSFAESWAALVHAARIAGIPYPKPWPWVVDGFIVAMALTIVEADRDHRARFAWWPRLGLLAATSLSVWIQAAYAPEGGEWLAAWSPLAVLFSFECLVWLWRPSWESVSTPSAVPVPATVPASAGPPSGPEHPVETRPKAARSGRPVALGRPTLPKADQQALDRAKKKGPVEVERVMVERGLERSVVAARPERWPLPSQNGHGGGS